MKHGRSWHRVIMPLALCGALWGSAANISAQSGDLAEARRLSARAIELGRAGRYDEALPLAERVLAISEKVLGAKHPAVASSLNNLAVLYKEKGDYGRAEPRFQRALVIFEAMLGAGHPEVAKSLNNLAVLYKEKGDYGRAEPRFQRALAIYEKVLPAEHPLIADSLLNLAGLYYLKGDYGSAEELDQRALTIYKKALPAGHPLIATSLNNLAMLYEAKGDYGRAESSYRSALVIREKALPAGHPDVANTLNNLAGLYYLQGDYGLAEPLFRRALAIREKAFDAEHPDVADSLNSLAVLYENAGDHERAEPLFQRALTIFEKALGAEHPYVATSLNNLAGLYEAKGDYERAIAGRAHAADIREQNIASILITGSETRKQLYLDTISDETDRIIWLNVQDPPKNVRAAQLALATILRRKGRALDAMTDQIAALRRRAAPGDQELFDQLADARSQRANLQLGSADGNFTSAAQQAHIARLAAEAEKLEGTISRRSAEFSVQIQPVTLEAVQQALPADAALVELFSYRPFNAKAVRVADRFDAPRYVAFVMKQKGAITSIDLGPVEAIDRATDQFLTALSNPASVNAKEAGRTLDEIVARPLRKLLGDMRHVLISPDGKLNLVPFAALVDEHGRYLVENYTISYLTSGRDLVRLNVPRQSKQMPVVIANPAFNLTITSTLPNTLAPVAGNRALAASQTGTEPAEARGRRSGNMLRANWTELRGTAEEADYLKKLLPHARVLTGKDATEGALKQVAAPRILHLATHGFFLPDQSRDPNDKVKTVGENPLLRSGLVLAGANNLQGGGGEDGVLTALEAAGLNLWGTQLVVLSACETGVGDVRSGEGVYGLRRALVLAGTESQVMTLWKVDDTATSEAIIEYYRRLQAGEGRAEALRWVQLEFMRRETKQHPFFWASFIFNGDWRSMQ